MTLTGNTRATPPELRPSRAAADVVLEKVWKRYPGGMEAVKGIDLSIASGEFVVLVGPSGCGKTTTLRMIAGLEDITSGTLKIGGRVVNNVPPRDRDIAMVFQSYALYPHMTVRENMAFGLELRKTSKEEIRTRVDAAAQMLGLAESGILDRKPKALSGGQRQRVAMGRAIVRQPAVFLFDEPLSNLDAKLRVQMRLEIAALHRRVGATMVYVTHDQVEAMTLADRIAVMSMGEVQQFASPMEVYLRPKNRFVAGFIGSPAMNFIDGRLNSVGDVLHFVAPGLDVPLAPEHAERLKAAGALERPVTLGVRPQGLASAADGRSSGTGAADGRSSGAGAADGRSSGAGAADGRSSGTGAANEGSIGSGRVIHVELMGSEIFAHVEVGGPESKITLVVRLPGDQPVGVGDTLPLGVDTQKLHVFDASGVNLTLDPHPAPIGHSTRG